MSTNTALIESPKHFVQIVQRAAQRARGGMMDDGTDIVGRDLFPKLWTDDWDNILTVTSRLLANDREVTALDAHNLSYLIHRDDQLLALLSVGQLVEGFEEFPEPIECIRRWT
jgi:hypothetical protein